MDTSTSVSSVCGICALFLSSGLPFSITCPDFSKCTSLCIGLYAVKIRAEAMQEASEAVPSGMLSVLGQRQSKFAIACLEAQEHCKTQGIENPVCEVSNYLFPDCRVISGHLEVGVGGSSLPRTQSGAEHGTYCREPAKPNGCSAQPWSWKVFEGQHVCGGASAPEGGWVLSPLCHVLP